MIALTRALCRACVLPERFYYDQMPIQLGMGAHPWSVAVCSMLMCRARRSNVEPVLQELLSRWPTPGDMCRAEGHEELLRPLGLQRNRARQLQRFSSLYLSEAWSDLRQLPGVGIYVADAVGLFCFGCTELIGNDAVLRGYVDARDHAEPAAQLHD